MQYKIFYLIGNDTKIEKWTIKSKFFFVQSLSKGQNLKYLMIF